MSIHPGQQCGPCSLCGQKSSYYVHPLNWEESIKQKLFQTENVEEKSCVCKPCERNIKRYITAENYQPRWRPKSQESCIIPTCPLTSQDGVIIHTGLVTAGQVAELLHTNVPETKGQLTPLCQAHYRHVIASCIPKRACMSSSSVSHAMPG